MKANQRSRLTKTPTTNRNLPIYVALSALAVPHIATAQASDNSVHVIHDERDVVRMVHMRSPKNAVANAMDHLADVRSQTAGLLPNPNVAWGRETVQTGPLSGQGSQDIVNATLPIDFVRPMSARAMAASESAWTHSQASQLRTQAALEAVLAYIDVILAEQRMRLLSQSLENLDEAARVLRERETAGAASGYESTRLAIESELTRSRLAKARMKLEGAKSRLAVLLDVKADTLRTEDLLPPLSASEEATLIAQATTATKSLQHARQSQDLASKAEARAAWTWLPALELWAGFKRANNFGALDGYGYSIGASIDLPVFDHGQAQRQQAQAQHVLAKARSEALTQQVNAELEQALATFRLAREELLRFESQTKGQVDVLLAAARSGYREGVRTIVELLDAQRAQTEVAQQHANLLGSAKRAEAHLRAAAGDFQ